MAAIPTKRYVLTEEFLNALKFRDFGQAWKSDGSNDFITIGNAANLYSEVMIDKAWGCSFWVKRPSTAVAGQSVFWGNITNDFDEANPYNPNPNIVLRFGINENGIYLYHYSDLSGGSLTDLNIAAVSVTPQPSDKWVHIVYNYDGTIRNNVTPPFFEMYRDGRLVSPSEYTSNTHLFTAPQITLPQNTMTARFAKRVEWNNLITGNVYSQYSIADFMFVKRVLTKTEIWQMYKNGTNKSANYATQYPAAVLADRVLHYSFDAPNYTGFTVNDLSGTANNGTVTNQLPLTTENFYLP